MSYFYIFLRKDYIMSDILFILCLLFYGIITSAKKCYSIYMDYCSVNIIKNGIIFGLAGIILDNILTPETKWLSLIMLCVKHIKNNN